MKSFGKIILFITATLVVWSLWTPDAYAQRRGLSTRGGFSGDMALGIGFSYTGVSQDDLNSAIDNANTSTAGGISTKNLGSAYELFVNFIYRMERSSYALVFRPSYMTQSTTGSGSTGSFDYKLNGYTVFPMFRLYALENDFIHFFMQGGLGYGSLSGDITAGPSNLTFSGSAFGAVGGIGVDFCFTEAHCLTVEGNMRYLPIERNISTGGNCSASQTIPGISQCGSSMEVERNNNDLKTSMSGVQGILAYTLKF